MTYHVQQPVVLHSCVFLVTQGWQDQSHQHPVLQAHDAACSAEAATAATAVLAAGAATLEAEQRATAASRNTTATALAEDDATLAAEATPDSKVCL